MRLPLFLLLCVVACEGWYWIELKGEKAAKDVPKQPTKLAEALGKLRTKPIVTYPLKKAEHENKLAAAVKKVVAAATKPVKEEPKKKLHAVPYPLKKQDEKKPLPPAGLLNKLPKAEKEKKVVAAVKKVVAAVSKPVKEEPKKKPLSLAGLLKKTTKAPQPPLKKLAEVLKAKSKRSVVMTEPQIKVIKVPIGVKKTIVPGKKVISSIKVIPVPSKGDSSSVKIMPLPSKGDSSSVKIIRLPSNVVKSEWKV
ncbi:hypothetical protein Q1695_014571 [Nippostrongylus brasiliensis]|nr:hypothetical protein Q1695_014571 [Nippostrongylus brasiliensis]